MQIIDLRRDDVTPRVRGWRKTAEVVLLEISMGLALLLSCVCHIVAVSMVCDFAVLLNIAPLSAALDASPEVVELLLARGGERGYP